MNENNAWDEPFGGGGRGVVEGTHSEKRVQGTVMTHPVIHRITIIQVQQ